MMEKRFEICRRREDTTCMQKYPVNVENMDIYNGHRSGRSEGSGEKYGWKVRQGGKMGREVGCSSVVQMVPIGQVLWCEAVVVVNEGEGGAGKGYCGGGMVAKEGLGWWKWL